MKRVFDLLVSVLILIVFFPLFLILSVAIIMTDGRPIFYVQKRVGRNGKEFGMFKFRSMVNDADLVGPYFTTENDSRITKVGRFIRKTSLDELPQILNVLIGDMSLIGPRPNVAEQKELYSAGDWDLRNSVRPGITGLAQVSGRSTSNFNERLEQDLIYIRDFSFYLDFKILLKTFYIVIVHKGAN